MKNWRAGERRKFARNMQFNPTARQIGCMGFGFLRLIAPLLLVIGMTAVAYAVTTHQHSGVAMAAAGPMILASAPKNINALRNQKTEIKTKAAEILAAGGAAGTFTEEQKKELAELKAKLEALNTDIDNVEAFLDDERKTTALAATQSDRSNGAKKPWMNMGEYMQAVSTFFRSMGRTVDERLYASVPKDKHIDSILAAAQGANESVPAEGGFLVIPEYAQELIKRTYDVGILSSRCAKMPMSSARLVMHAVDEDSRVDGSRWGGILAYWVAEAGSYTATKPKFREMQLVANKLIGLCYATEEQLADGPALASYMGQAFPDEFSFKIDAAIFNGSGAGQPLGILKSGALLQVAKDAGPQTTKTITTTNILNMWSRLFARSRQTAAWFINQDAEPQLYPLTLGSGTAVVLLYTPPGVMGNPGPYGLLMGRPVIPIEQASTLGTEGDIILADMNSYLLAQHSDVRSDTSIHVAFLTGEQAFRFMLRLDGQPMWKKPLTPYNGSNTLSPFISLQTR